MGTWNAMTSDGKDTILRVVRQEAEPVSYTHLTLPTILLV